jgi:hypothetical protein
MTTLNQLKLHQKNSGVAGWDAPVRAGVAAFVLLAFTGNQAN